jgi:ABC-type cobalt transport system substrate-binding protein
MADVLDTQGTSSFRSPARAIYPVPGLPAGLIACIVYAEGFTHRLDIPPFKGSFFLASKLMLISPIDHIFIPIFYPIHPIRNPKSKHIEGLLHHIQKCLGTIVVDDVYLIFTSIGKALKRRPY